MSMLMGVRRRMRRMLVPTLKEAPADAVATSHILLTRAGLIRPASGAGLYSFLPLAVRVLEKIERIVDEELQTIGAQKVRLPLLAGANLWRSTGRWDATGQELFKLADRRGQDYCLAPTHEEAMTELASFGINSYRDLPLRLYQIGQKFRDELRPRSGLLRCREFLMKDMYSFDTSERASIDTYHEVASAYEKIFNRMELQFIKVRADSGTIGGSLSHEYHIVGDGGESHLLKCRVCSYCAEADLASSRIAISETICEAQNQSGDAAARIPWCNTSRCSILVVVPVNANSSAHPIVGLVPMSRTLSLLALKAAVGDASDYRFATHEEQADTLKNLENASVIVDMNVPAEDYALAGKNIQIAAIARAEAGDNCCVDGCNGQLFDASGIEVAHIFHLGSKYSLPLHVTYTDAKNRNLAVDMGCYGIGISRLLAGVVEYNADAHGIVWPKSIAPFTVAVISNGQGTSDTTALELCLQLQDDLCLGDDVILDDREERFGSKIKQAELIGFPYIIVVGRDIPIVEVHERRNRVKHMIAIHQVPNWLRDRIKNAT